MLTPQQIEEVSFKKVTFGGYDMQAVDEFLEPLTQDYINLYKENALLKSKMRVLVGKLEEYRQNEASMKDAIVNAQKTCDMMVKEAENKCSQMLNDANHAVAQNAKTTSSLIAEEKARVEEARRTAAAKISELQVQMSNCIELLERIKEENRPHLSKQTRAKFYDTNASQAKTGAMAEEIAHNLAAMMGTDDDDADMKVAPSPSPSKTRHK